MQPDSITVLANSFHNFDEFATTVKAWDLDFIQLEKGPFYGNLAQCIGEEVQFSYCHLNRRHAQGGTPPQGLRTFAILSSQSTPIIFRNRPVHQEGIIEFPSNEEIDAISYPAFGAFTVSFTENVLEGFSKTMGLPHIEDMLHEKDFTAIPREESLQFRSWLQNFRSKIPYTFTNSLHGNLIDSLTSELPRRFLKTLATSYPIMSMSHPSARKRDRAMKLIKDFIAEFPAEKLTIGHLCEAGRVSERTLDYAFQETYGLSPYKFLLAYRLHGSRRDLRSADPISTTITKVAMDWGFWHLGRFAAIYREFFGEFPSDTLKRSDLGLLKH